MITRGWDSQGSNMSIHGLHLQHLFFFFLARHNVFRDCIILLYLGYSISTGPDNLTLLRAVSLCVDPKDRAEEMFGGLEGYTQRREPPYLPNN